MPYIAPQNLANTSITWNYTTIPQTGLDGQSIAYPRGRLLGGSSAISKIVVTSLPNLSETHIILSDFLVYTRGTNEEYDRWAEITDDPGWSWDQLAPYYFKVNVLRDPLWLFLLTTCFCRVHALFHLPTVITHPGK